jgi:hypothetical protein
MAVFWVVAPCSLPTFQRTLLPPSSDNPDDWGSKVLWNFGKFIPDYTAQQPRRQPSSYQLPWEPQILLRENYPSLGHPHSLVDRSVGQETSVNENVRRASSGGGSDMSFLMRMLYSQNYSLRLWTCNYSTNMFQNFHLELIPRATANEYRNM